VPPQKLYISENAYPMACHVPGFCWVTLFNPKVIGGDMLNFKLIFDPFLKKFVRGNPVFGGGCASKTWSFSSACKNLGVQHPLAEIWSSEKDVLGGYNLTFRSPWILDQSSLDFYSERRRNCGRSCTCPILNIFILSGNICRQILKSFEIAPNFVCFWPLNFFGGEGHPKLWTGIIKLNILLTMVQNFAAIG